MIQTEEKKLVLKAIDELGRSVTPADVATKTGLPILVATSELNKVASEVNGHLEVSTTGDIKYKFVPGFQSVYLAKGLQRQLELIGKKTFEIGFLVLKFSFGVMLILSFIVVVLLIIAAMLAGRGDRDDDRGGGFEFDFFDYLILRDLLFWGTYSSYPTYVDYSTPAVRKPSKGNFFTKCFSFLFGDGDPNAHLEERKWQMVAQLIRENHGVVSAEQLAPYTGAKTGDEDGALPVLVRFNGTPEVTDDGNIIYTFPSMRVSSTYLEIGKLPRYLREFRREFSVFDPDECMPVYLLAGANLLGSWWLFSQSTHIPVLFTFHALITCLVIYGTLFVAVPAVRWAVLNYINSRIETRNQKREAAASVLANPSSELLKKLAQVRDMQLKILAAPKPTDQVIYSTDKDLLEQEFEAPRMIEQEFEPPRSS
jgi:hypothetical protein